MLGCVVHGNAKQSRMQIRLLGQQADALLIGAGELLEARNDLPHIRALGQRWAAITSRTAKHDPRVIELVSALDDEPIEQRGKPSVSSRHR